MRVRVPATSANLGPGFDSFGLALGWYDEVTAEVASDGVTVEVDGEAAAAVPRDASHLVVASMLAAFRRWAAEPPGLRVRCHNSIPHGRGLGSSAAAIVAGVVAARALLGEDGVDEVDVLALAAELEGHPDNVAAALHGGFTLAWEAESGARCVRLAPHPAVLPVVCVPDWPMSTEAARGLLPPTVPHADAVFNSARSGLLVAALTERPELLLEATRERLHQRYRAAAMPPAAELLAELRTHAIPAVLSGAGPTVMALCDARRHDSGRVAEVAEGARRDCGDAAGRWRVESPPVDLEGARVQWLARSAE